MHEIVNQFFNRPIWSGDTILPTSNTLWWDWWLGDHPERISTSYYRVVDNFPKFDEWVVSDSQGNPVSLRLDVALAGYPREAIKILAVDQTLRISSDYKQEPLPEGGGTRSIAHRSFTLERVVNPLFDPKKAVAKYENGILSLTLPTKENYQTEIVLS